MTTSVSPTVRAFAGEEDLPTVVRIVNAELEADRLEERWSLESTRAFLDHPSDQFDARRDILLAELDGRVVAVAGGDWVDTRDGQLREFRLWGAVDPEYRGRGIGRTLLAANERRAAALAATQTFDRPASYGSFASAGRPAESVLRHAGYEVARWFFDMVRPTLDGVAAVPMPDGLELRPVTPEQHVAIWRANREAFRDHWGGSDESEHAMRRVIDNPETDTSLWLIAWDGDEVAGGVWNDIHDEENAALGLRRGWLGSVFTRRRWRRRGLAAALIARSLVLLRERGMTSAALGVDADNPSGALGLYETAGFAVHERFSAWRRMMEEAPSR
jgi:mycothiol synthase